MTAPDSASPSVRHRGEAKAHTPRASLVTWVALAIALLGALMVWAYLSGRIDGGAALRAVLALVFCTLLLFDERSVMSPPEDRSDTGQATRDTGLASAILTVFAAAGLPLVDLTTLQAFDEAPNLAIGLGAALILSGTWLRRTARRELGRHFSHALAVRTDHRVIDYGLYARIRHPAYLGTLILIPGLSLFIGSWISVFALPIATLAVHRRIVVEERMLLSALGSDYAAYRERTAALVPGLY